MRERRPGFCRSEEVSVIGLFCFGRTLVDGPSPGKRTPSHHSPINFASLLPKSDVPSKKPGENGFPQSMAANLQSCYANDEGLFPTTSHR